NCGQSVIRQSAIESEARDASENQSAEDNGGEQECGRQWSLSQQREQPHNGDKKVKAAILCAHFVQTVGARNGKASPLSKELGCAEGTECSKECEEGKGSKDQC